MLTLHHAPKSRSSRIIWLLEELGAPYPIQLTTIKRGDGSGAADPHNPHPDKKVPALVHDDAVITESAAVCLYLTDAYPAAGIGPVIGDPLRGPYLTWLAYYAGVIEPVVTLGFAGVLEHPMIHRTFAGREAMDRRILEALARGPYILGDRFSAVDILVGSMGQWARSMLPAGELVDGYLARLAERPALKRAFARDQG